MRLPCLPLLVVLAAGSVAQAQPEAPGDATTAGSVPCSQLNNTAIEATTVIRQYVSVLSTGIETERGARGMTALSWLDPWAGRPRGLVDVADVATRLDDGDMETYRRALAMATRVANTAQDELLRPARAAIQQQPPPRRRS
jgi:hypothetical protein